MTIEIEDIFRWIAEKTGLELGNTLQATYFLNTAPDRCSMVRLTGKPNEDYFPRAELLLHVYSRGLGWNEGWDDAMKFYDTLNIQGSVLALLPQGNPTFRIETCEAVQLPQWLEYDEKKRHVFYVAFKINVFQLKNIGG